MENLIEILKALADETRLKIITLLLANDFCVGALAKNIGLTEAAISQHLQILRNAKLVKGEKRGYFTHYIVDKEVLKNTAEEIIKTVSMIQQCQGRYSKNSSSKNQTCCRYDDSRKNKKIKRSKS